MAGLLLLLKKNRSNQSWLCFAALIITSALISALGSLIIEIAPADEMADILNGIALGLCTAWLLAPYLARRSHVANFFLLICILLPVNLVSILFAHGLDDANDRVVPMIAYFIMCSFIAFNISLAFSLASRLSKKNYSSTRFFVRLLVLTLLIWVLSTIIFPAMQGSWSGYFTVILVSALAVFLVQLPLLLISFANLNFRKRLEAWQAREPMPLPEP